MCKGNIQSSSFLMEGMKFFIIQSEWISEERHIKDKCKIHTTTVPTMQFFMKLAAAAAKSLQSCPTLCHPHRWQPNRLPRPWDSPGKNTGVGCHFLLQCRKMKSENEVAQSCPTLRDPMDCSLPGFSVHGYRGRQEYWSAIAFSHVILDTY